jgi:hypothetical protein
MKALIGACLLLALASGCTERTDSPTKVHDFRVLGMSTESPELMVPSCDANNNLEALVVLGSEVTFRALLVDPRDETRSIRYELFACSSAPDALCDPEEERVLLAEGTTTPGELVLRIRPGIILLPDGTPLLQRVQERDPYRGLGGLRMPLVLHAVTGEDEVWATKLMVFSCKLFPDQTQNVQPVLPGLRLNNEPWHEEVVPVLQGEGPFEVTPEDFEARQEHYVVPSLKLERVALTEAWEISWHATLGQFSPGETGGAEINGEMERQRTEWRPPEDGTEQEVTFWAVVRDGRGGQSWLKRRARWVP